MMCWRKKGTSTKTVVFYNLWKRPLTVLSLRSQLHVFWVNFQSTKPETNKCTNGMKSAPMVGCTNGMHWCTGGKVEEKKAASNKGLATNCFFNILHFTRQLASDAKHSTAYMKSVEKTKFGRILLCNCSQNLQVSAHFTECTFFQNIAELLCPECTQSLWRIAQSGRAEQDWNTAHSGEKPDWSNCEIGRILSSSLLPCIPCCWLFKKKNRN